VATHTRTVGRLQLSTQGLGQERDEADATAVSIWTRRLCEHAFVGEKGSAGALFWRAIQSHNVVAAESAAWEMNAATGNPVPLDFALALTHLYGEKRDGRYELAALRYLSRYINEAKPSLLDVAGVAAVLAERMAR